MAHGQYDLPVGQRTPAHPESHENISLLKELGKSFHKYSYRVALGGVVLGLALILCADLLHSYGDLQNHGIDLQDLSVELLVHLGIGSFVAAFATVFFDVLVHNELIGKPLQKIKADITGINTEVEKTVKTVEELTSVIGYTELRREILLSYADAHERIISVSDFWPVDEDWWKIAVRPETQWWKEPDAWNNCPLYLNLKAATPKEVTYTEESVSLTTPDDEAPTRLEIIFIGTMPWPDSTSSLKPALDAYEFGRLIGLIWRLNITHWVRHAKGQQGSEDVRVVIANIPVKATIVDNNVFLILPREEHQESWRGTRLTGIHPAHSRTPQETERDMHIANNYADLVLSYIRQSRSAREYVNSILSLAEIYDASIDKEQIVFNYVKNCLNILGMPAWLQSKTVNEKSLFEEKAVGIVKAFLTFYSVRASNSTAETLKFKDLRNELI